MSDLLKVLWNRVELAARAMPTDGGLYGWGEDDAAMRDADADSLLAWCDDCADRLGADEGNFRAALHDFIIARDDGDGLAAEDYAAALAEMAGNVEGERDIRHAIAERTGDAEDTARLAECERAMDESVEMMKAAR